MQERKNRHMGVVISLHILVIRVRSLWICVHALDGCFMQRNGKIAKICTAAFRVAAFNILCLCILSCSSALVKNHGYDRQAFFSFSPGTAVLCWSSNAFPATPPQVTDSSS